MAIELFRIRKGIEIDNSVCILYGDGPPGSSQDTDDAGVGSMYLDATNGDSYSKINPSAGSNSWQRIAAEGQNLYREHPVTPAPGLAAGPNSMAFGQAAQTAPEAHDAVAIGPQSYARLPGLVQASGRFGSSGDAQAGRYILRTVSVNQFATTMFFDGTNGTERLTLPDDCTWRFKATIVGHRIDAEGHAGYTIEGLAYRLAGPGTTSILGSTIKNIIAESDPAWDVEVVADTVNGSLNINVTGESGKTIRWVAIVETVEVTN